MHQEALTEKGQVFFSKLEQFSDFYLAGGTALALQIGHRISVDFDLFCHDDIKKELLPKVQRVFPTSQILPLINNSDELSVLVDEVKFTFLKYPFPVLNDFVILGGIKTLGVLELSVTKAYTIGRRGSLKDYVDLYYVLSENFGTLEQIIELAEKKYGSEFNSRLFLEQLIYLDDIEDLEMTFLKNPIGKEKIKVFFITAVKKIQF